MNHLADSKKTIDTYIPMIITGNAQGNMIKDELGQIRAEIDKTNKALEKNNDLLLRVLVETTSATASVAASTVKKD